MRSRCATGGELAEQHVQAADGLGAQRGEVVVAVGQQPQHGGVIITSTRRSPQ